MSDQVLRCGIKYWAFLGPFLGASCGAGYGCGESLERFATLEHAPVFIFTAFASIVSGAVLTLGDAWVLISLRLHPWTS